MASLIDLKLSSNITIFPASLAASVPLPMAKPTSARFNAGESLTPSPVMPTTRFISWHSRTILDLSVGSARAITRICGIIRFTSSSDILFNWADEIALSSGFCKGPASFAMATAVSSLSPVIMTTCIPASCTSRIASFASLLTSSRIPTRPIRTTSSWISFSLSSRPEYPNASTRIAFAANSSIFAFNAAWSNGQTVPSASRYFSAFASRRSGAPL